MKKNTQGKTIINLLKRHMKNAACLVMVYEVLIKPGSSNRILENCRISAGTELFDRIFCEILQERLRE